MILVMCTFIMLGIKLPHFCFKGIGPETFRALTQRGVVRPGRGVAFGMEVCFGIIMRRVGTIMRL